MNFRQLFKKHSLSTLAKNLELTPLILFCISEGRGIKIDLSFEKDMEGQLYRDMELEAWGIQRVRWHRLFKLYPEVQNIHQRRFQQICAMLLKKSEALVWIFVSRFFISSIPRRNRIEKQRITIIVLFLVGNHIIHLHSPSNGCKIDILQPDALEQVASGNIEGFETLISTFDAPE